MAVGESMTGTMLQVALKGRSFFAAFQGHKGYQPPRSELRRMGIRTGIVTGQPGLYVIGQTDVPLQRLGFASK